MIHTVADILRVTHRPIVWVPPLDSVYDALKLMHEENVHSLLVQIDGYVVGIVSERDYVRKVIFNRQASRQTKVSEIMTQEVITVTREDTVFHCIALMKRHQVRHLPVMDTGKAIGMVSLTDLFHLVLEDAILEKSVAALQ